jgi:uncharacterized secreted protein with C-terminal beta-propeller domain
MASRHLLSKHRASTPALAVLAVFLVVFIFLISTGSASGQVRVMLDGRQLSFEVPPEIENGRTLVPLRDIFEAMGAEVTWDEKGQAVTATLGETTLQLVIGQKIAYKNGGAIELEVAPKITKEKTLVPLRFIGESFDAEVNWAPTSKIVYINSQPPQLPVVGSYENLKKLLAEAENNRAGIYKGFPGTRFRIGAEIMVNEKALESTETAKSASAVGLGPDYSATNVQVQGVDEADMVKTDGQYIYQVNNRRVVVARAYPATAMEVVGIVEFSDKYFYPRELYLDEKYLVVIGSNESYYSKPIPLPGPIELMPESPRLPGYLPSLSTVQAMVYDLSNKAELKLVREVELEGHYISSRKIGSALYLVTNKYFDYYYILNEPTAGEENASPLFRDSAGKDEFVPVDYQDIRYFPGSVDSNYLMVGGLNLDNPGQEVEISTYLGAGQNIYASLENLYVTVSKYEFDQKVQVSKQNTEVYKFGLNRGRVTYRNKGTVPGMILNQFSMDEHQGYFRIATTTGDMWRDDEHTSKNNVYILNEKMVMTGKVEDIAPGEKIYSVRFMGDRGYMVTFKTVDPLFVIDLKDPANPVILGALKIPGYSDYLHPYDENHLIGFGKDAVEVDNMAYYLGMKIALFDVSNVHNPIEKFTEMIGDRGTESEILQNHKALLFSKEKNLLAFPVTVMEVKDNNQYNYKGIPPYGQFTFQGAYVYHLDPETGFTLQGKITHLTEEDYLKAGQHWYDSAKNVERLLYIDDNLYTLSQRIWKAHGLNDLVERNALVIPSPR